MFELLQPAFGCLEKQSSSYIYPLKTPLHNMFDSVKDTILPIWNPGNINHLRNSLKKSTFAILRIAFEMLTTRAHSDGSQGTQILRKVLQLKKRKG